MHNQQSGDVISDNVPLLQYMYLVFTRMPDESYRRRLRSWLYVCNVFGALLFPATALSERSILFAESRVTVSFAVVGLTNWALRGLEKGGATR